MIKLEKIFSLLSTLFAVLIFAFLIFIIWSYTKNSALHSCVYSVGSDVVEYSSEISNFARNSGNWYVLTDDEAKSVLENISFRRCHNLTSQPQDMKERKLKIAVKRNGEHSYEITVWSNGFDNISGTPDDIVFPYGEKVPQ